MNTHAGPMPHCILSEAYSAPGARISFPPHHSWAQPDVRNSRESALNTCHELFNSGHAFTLRSYSLGPASFLTGMVALNIMKNLCVFRWTFVCNGDGHG